MKENQVEFVFIGIIIIVFAIWKISEIIKTKCYDAKIRRKEGFETEKAKEDKEHSETANNNNQPELMTKLHDLFNRNRVEPFMSNEPLSTEKFTVETPEHEMTLNQRKKAATVIDGFKDGEMPPPPVNAPNTDKPINAVKEGLENPDENTKEFIDKNITSINVQDSQSKFKLRDYYIKSAYNALIQINSRTQMSVWMH